MPRRSSWLLVSAFALAACSKTGDRGAEAPGADTTSVERQAAGPIAIVTVFYNAPKDPAAFERYYKATHLPLLMASQDEIGFVRTDFTKFVSTADGKKPTFYRQAELYFNSTDLANFASGGVIGMIATSSEPHETGSGQTPAAIVTVIYKTPKDTAAFEKYYTETHLPLLSSNKNEIGFERAEFTKFMSNLDGSAPSRYRQAELYFASMDALKKGTATPGFKKVAGDIPNFASGGSDALVGVETK
jgi:uncharacterized protein (TIGR02118 family)